GGTCMSSGLPSVGPDGMSRMSRAITSSSTRSERRGPQPAQKPAHRWARGACAHKDDAQSRSGIQADGETRTPVPFITSEVLYQLSYVGGAPTVAVCRGASRPF